MTEIETDLKMIESLVRFPSVSSTKLRLKLALVFSKSSHRRCSVRKGVLRNLAKFTGKQLCHSLFFNKGTGWGLQLYEKRDSATGVSLWVLRNF